MEDNEKEIETEEKSKTISRRQFLKDAGLVVGGATVGSVAILSACGETKTITNTSTVTSTVGAGSTVTVTSPPTTVTVTSPGTTTPATQVWGREVYPPPPQSGYANIITIDDRCTGCALCANACSIKHFGILNKDASAIQVRQPQIPIIKGISVVCVQCQMDERECEKACPTTPKSIHYDADTKHMVINKATCLGGGCLLCRAACNAKAVRFNALVSDKPFICDLCDVDNTGNRDPECVKICPNSALAFVNVSLSIPHWHRRGMMEKADMLAKRISPLTKESFCFPDRNW